MNEQLKEALNRSLAELAEVQTKLNDVVKELPGETSEVGQSIQQVLKTVGKKLDESRAHGESLGDEAQLQAHLAIMEAREKLEASRKVLDDHLTEVAKNGKSLLDELELKAHLAKMEAEDFWERRGPELTDEFNKSRESLTRLAETAMDEIQTQFKKWNTVFGNNDKKT